jgi:hypothetical protein
VLSFFTFLSSGDLIPPVDIDSIMAFFGKIEHPTLNADTSNAWFRRARVPIPSASSSSESSQASSSSPSLSKSSSSVSGCLIQPLFYKFKSAQGFWSALRLTYYDAGIDVPRLV